jgi:NDP-sugar pyrophosphorylase family protein
MVRTVLITTSGIGDRLKYFTKNTNKSLVTVGDKYAICYIIDNYDNDTEFIVTIGYYGNYVKEFLLLAYPEKHFTFVEIDIFYGPGSSLGYSMIKAMPFLQKPFIFHCCDAIVLDKIEIKDNDKNILFVYPYKNSDQYTNIKGINNKVIEINSKKHLDFDYVYTGIAYIYNYSMFWNNLKQCYESDANNSSLSDVNSFKLMISDVEINYSVLNNWYDTGNIESYLELKKEIKSNYCVIEKNYESLCFLGNKVIKFINDKEINKKRVIRGNHLYPLTPQILGHSDNFISMEYVNGTLMSNNYNFGFIYNLLEWSKENLWNEQVINTEFISCCKKFYIDKTVDRLSKLTILENEKNIINGLTCKNIINFIKEIPEDTFTNNTFTKFHGDFILDNIIKTTDSYKLLDYRHEFDNQLYYGDIYYDLAKLRHNLFFNHDNVSNNLFRIEYKDDEVIVDLKCNYFLIQQLNDFEKFVIENNYDLNKIKKLTAIIWLNMSPLYDGKLSEFLFYFGKYNLFVSI